MFVLKAAQNQTVVHPSLVKKKGNIDVGLVGAWRQLLSTDRSTAVESFLPSLSGSVLLGAERVSGADPLRSLAP